MRKLYNSTGEFQGHEGNDRGHRANCLRVPLSTGLACLRVPETKVVGLNHQRVICLWWAFISLTELGKVELELNSLSHARNNIFIWDLN